MYSIILKQLACVEWPLEGVIFATFWVIFCGPGCCFIGCSMFQYMVLFLPQVEYIGLGTKGRGYSITLNETVAKYLLPVPAILGSAGLQIFIPKGRLVLPGNKIFHNKVKIIKRLSRNEQHHYLLCCCCSFESCNNNIQLTYSSTQKAYHLLDEYTRI